MPDRTEPHARLLRVFAAAIASVEGGRTVRQALAAAPTDGPVWPCAIGKAAESMLLGACDALGANKTGGLLVTKAGHCDPRRLARLGITALIGGHPVPTSGSLDAGARLVAAIESLPGETEALFLISGGASSLVEVPIPGLALADLQRINQWLLGSGLPIDSMNLVRKSISRIKAGGLLRFLTGRRVRQLAISDVPGDEAGVIGSGLLVPDPDLADGVGRLDLPDWLGEWVRHGLADRADCAQEGPAMQLVATLRTAMDAAADLARREGLATWPHPAPLQGDAASAGRNLARALIGSAPGLHIWGGETSVRLSPHPGRGGRNQHLALAAAIEFAGRDDCLLLSAGTDGTDGPTEDAGALVDGGTLERAALAGLDAAAALARADAGTLLAASGDLIQTGPTGTNVMDVILGLKL